MRRILAIVVAVMISATAIGCSANTAKNETTGAKAGAKKDIRTETMTDSDQKGDWKNIVAMVNGTPITRDEFSAFAREYRAFINPKASTHTLIEAIIRDTATRQEAQRLGITVSEKELDAELERQKAIYADAKTPKNIRDSLTRMMTQLKYDNNTFWTSEELRNTIRFELLRWKMAEYLVGQAKSQAKDTNASQSKNADAKVTSLRQYIDTLAKNADVEVLIPTK